MKKNFIARFLLLSLVLSSFNALSADRHLVTCLGGGIYGVSIYDYASEGRRTTIFVNSGPFAGRPVIMFSPLNIKLGANRTSYTAQGFSLHLATSDVKSKVGVGTLAFTRQGIKEVQTHMSCQVSSLN